MTTALFQNGRSQVVRLPQEMRLPGKEVSIRRFGAGVLIEPVTQTEWPLAYFDAIQIEDEAFARANQGAIPPILRIEE